MPPSPQARKYLPLYSSMLGLGRAFSRVDIVAGGQLNAIDSVVVLLLGIQSTRGKLIVQNQLKEERQRGDC